MLIVMTSILSASNLRQEFDFCVDLIKPTFSTNRICDDFSLHSVVFMHRGKGFDNSILTVVVRNNKIAHNERIVFS